jgi:DNA-binding beta-propeller fold protein YncE
MTMSLGLTVMLAGAALGAQAAPDRDYLVFVGSEGDDRVALVRFGPKGASVERQLRVGTNPTELVGPHGLGVSPDGRYYYVSTAHGTPNGALLKLTTAGDTLVGRVVLGAFPATLQVSPDGAYVYVANFNLHGDMVPSSVSVVYAPEMVEVARVRTCTMPHGSRLDARGARHYSACMMDDALVELDARTFAVSRHFMVAPGREHGMAGAPGAGHAAGGGSAAGHDMGARDAGGRPAAGASAAAPTPACSPTWAQPSPDGARVWVACNKSNDLVEIDATRWTMTRRLPAGDGVYNLAVTHDGRLLVATNKRGQSVSVFDAASGRELARLPTTRRLPSGVAVSPDDRYAFVSVEGVGSQPGTVEVIDLRALRTVATVDVGPQAGGIDVWRTEPPR